MKPHLSLLVSVLTFAALFVSPVNANTVCGSLLPEHLPTNTIEGSAVNEASKAALLQRSFCLRQGDVVYILPTITVSYLSHDTKTYAGAIRTRTRTFLKPASITADDNWITLHFANGHMRRFPSNAVIDDKASTDYELLIVHQASPIPEALRAVKPNYTYK